MKEIKITQANAQKIEAVLREINLKSTAHTYTRFDQIEALIVDAESRLTGLLKSKKHLLVRYLMRQAGLASAIHINILATLRALLWCAKLVAGI